LAQETEISGRNKEGCLKKTEIRSGRVVMIMMVSKLNHFNMIFIQLEAIRRPNIGLTLRGDLAMFTCSAITPPKVNQFGRNLLHSEYIVGAGAGRFWCDLR